MRRRRGPIPSHVLHVPSFSTIATLAADHRVSDGHHGALLLAHLRELLQQPEKL